MNNIKEAQACFSVASFGSNTPPPFLSYHPPSLHLSLSLSYLFIEGIACLCMLMGEGGTNKIRLSVPVPVIFLLVG
jgi:hypothetical protein